jgi:tRNA splicing ligase
MRGIIEQLKEQRVKAERRFIENSFIKRNCKIDEPCPDTDADLDTIAELNEAISILENATINKEQEPEQPDELL